MHVDTKTNLNDEKIDFVENRVASAEIETHEALKIIGNLEKKNEEIKESMLYMQSQSMRSNLDFGGIKEEMNESLEKTENILRYFHGGAITFCE